MAEALYKIKKLSVMFKRVDQPFFYQVNMEENSIEQVCGEREEEGEGRRGSRECKGGKLTVILTSLSSSKT